MKILYAGSPNAAAWLLEKLLGLLQDDSAAEQIEIAAVLTNPPSAKGRKKELIPTPVGLLAQEKNIPVYAPQKLDADFRQVIAAENFDLLVCFAYGKIFGPKFLSLFKMGGVNLHPSLLPKYRGATPIPAAILNMEKETAVTVQTLSLGMDEGDILAQQKIALDLTETADSLLNDAAKIGAELIHGVLLKTASLGRLPKGVPQQGAASYTKIISREDALINWNDSVQKIAAHIRAYTSEPGAWTRIPAAPSSSPNSESLKVLKATPLPGAVVENGALEKSPAPTSLGQESPSALNAVPGTVISFDKKLGILVKCGEGVLCVTELQRQQRNAMNFKDFMNGNKNFVGTILF